MTLISAEMLAMMQARINQLLPDTCDILSATNAPDGFGGITETWGTATAGVACRLDKKSGGEQVSGGAIQAYTGWVMSMPYSVTVTAANRLLHNGITYAVTSVNNDASWKAVTRCEVEKV